MALRPVTTHNRLWIIRIKRAMTRKYIAALLGHQTTSQLCRWETGTQVPNLVNALMLGYLLEMPVEFLFKDLREEVIHQVRLRQATRMQDHDNDRHATA